MELDDRKAAVRVPLGSNIFLSSSRQVLGLTQPPVKLVSGALSSGESGIGVKLTTHFQLVPS
jgi:hypothetical protein